ncbi:conjugal transfer protein TraH, partial [Klebsiella pneumoniae]|uniref:conjugal transfer protein TraH n=1 Tax=Klebsiella pneumoniae TaxID=573 RepID=UPI000E3A8767
FDENLVSFAPPSWKAGCGGVDLLGRTIKKKKTDQIVQLLRAVAANAKGYAFQLALDNVFPDLSLIHISEHTRPESSAETELGEQN